MTKQKECDLPQLKLWQIFRKLVYAVTVDRDLFIDHCDQDLPTIGFPTTKARQRCYLWHRQLPSACLDPKFSK